MRTILVWMVAGALWAVLPSCGLLRKWFPKKAAVEEVSPQDAEKVATRAIGEVVSVYLDEGFVLIRRYGGGDLPSEYIYNSVGAAGRTATLKPTGERSGRFHAADVTAGEVERGDVVVLRRLPEGTGPAVTPVPEKPSALFGMP